MGHLRTGMPAGTELTEQLGGVQLADDAHAEMPNSVGLRN